MSDEKTTDDNPYDPILDAVDEGPVTLAIWEQAKTRPRPTQPSTFERKARPDDGFNYNGEYDCIFEVTSHTGHFKERS
jgi:hypothetical protein